MRIEIASLELGHQHSRWMRYRGTEAESMILVPAMALEDLQ